MAIGGRKRGLIKRKLHEVLRGNTASIKVFCSQVEFNQGQNVALHFCRKVLHQELHSEGDCPPERPFAPSSPIFWGTLGITPVNEWSPPIPALHSTCAPLAKKPPETPSGNFSNFQFPGLSTPDFHQDAIGGFETCRSPQTSEVVFAHVVGTAPWNMHVFALPRMKSYA